MDVALGVRLVFISVENAEGLKNQYTEIRNNYKTNFEELSRLSQRETCSKLSPQVPQIINDLILSPSFKELPTLPG